ncbi:MAG: hypothetical protein Q9164_000187 [Protoblastenia rupestris]
MEHPPKRRRIERAVGQPPGDVISREGEYSAGTEVQGTNRNFKAPQSSIAHLHPFALDVLDKDQQYRKSLLKSSRDAELRFPRLELRQFTPTGAVDNVDDGITQPVNKVAQPVAVPITTAVHHNASHGRHHANKAIQSAVSEVVQPVASQAVNVPQDADNAGGPTEESLESSPPNSQTSVPQVNPLPENQPGVSQEANDASDDVSAPVDVAPGLISPLPAVAASVARAQALATQEAKAEQKNRILPSSEGPAPAPAPALPSNATPNPEPEPSQNFISMGLAGTASQKPLSQPSTPLPASPAATASLSSYFPSSQYTSDTPLPTQNTINIPINPPLPSSNSTMSSSATLAPSSATLSLSRLSVSSASQAAVSSMDSLSQLSLLGSSTITVLTRTSQDIITDSTSFPGTSLITSSASTPTNSPAESLTVSPTNTLIPSTLVTTTSGASQSNSLSSAPATSTEVVSSTDSNGMVFAGTPTSGGNPAASTSAGSGSGGGNDAPPTRVLVGGIVGGLAGVVLILIALLFLLRWRRDKAGQRRNISPPVPQTEGAGSAALGGSGTMTQRSSSVPIASAGFFGRLRPSSAQTVATTDTAPSERGFQKISGRKLPSVLHSGGDGYGNAPAVSSAGSSSSPPAKPIAPGQGPFAGLTPALRPSTPHSLSGSSFYRDSQGFYGGVVPADPSSDLTDQSTSPTSSSPTFPAPPSAGVASAGAGHPPGTPSPGIPNIRPGPARQPVINQGGVVPMRTPSRPQQPRPRPEPPIAENPFENPRDGLGRSHPSQDGSRHSRFRESTTLP